MSPVSYTHLDVYKRQAITRYVTVGLALFESVAMAIGFGRQGMIPNMSFLKGIVVVASLTAGSAMLKMCIRDRAYRIEKRTSHITVVLDER